MTGRDAGAAGAQPGYPSGVAARLAGVPYKTLDFWAVSGALVPSLAAGAGKGTDRRYSFADVVALRVLRELRGHMDMPAAAAIARYVAQRLDALRGPGTLLLWRRGVAAAVPAATAVRSAMAGAGGAPVFLLDVAGLADEVAREGATDDDD